MLIDGESKEREAQKEVIKRAFEEIEQMAGGVLKLPEITEENRAAVHDKAQTDIDQIEDPTKKELANIQISLMDAKRSFLNGKITDALVAVSDADCEAIVGYTRTDSELYYNLCCKTADMAQLLEDYLKY